MILDYIEKNKPVATISISNKSKMKKVSVLNKNADPLESIFLIKERVQKYSLILIMFRRIRSLL